MKTRQQVDVEWFLKHYGKDDARTVLRRAFECILECEREDKPDSCWLHPEFNNAGYAIVKIDDRSLTVSRLVLCAYTHKPLNYHNDQGEFMEAAHKTPVICRHRNCINPNHLEWLTHSENCKRREAEKRARKAASGGLPIGPAVGQQGMSFITT